MNIDLNGPSSLPCHLSHFSAILLCWCPHSPKRRSLFSFSFLFLTVTIYFSLFKVPAHTTGLLHLHSLDDLTSFDTDRTEATHTHFYPLATITEFTSFPGPTFPPFPFITRMKGLCPCRWQCLHISPSPYCPRNLACYTELSVGAT